MTDTFRHCTKRFALWFCVATFIASAAPAIGSPYTNPGPFVSPLPALPGLPSPAEVPGKELSRDPDRNTLPAGINFDSGQIIAWDGLGGIADGPDLSSIPFGSGEQFQVDALANTHDSLFQEVLDDAAHLIYSVAFNAYTTKDDGLRLWGSKFLGPVSIPDAIHGGTQPIGGAAELSYELGRFGGVHGANKHGIWATAAVLDNQWPETEVDALELWGPEPTVAAPGNSDKYSVYWDGSVFAPADPTTYVVLNAGVDTGYVPYSIVSDLVNNLLGVNRPEGYINVDALMVLDGPGSNPETFSAGDRILFSVTQVADPTAADGSGFLFTGSEIFWLDGASTAANPVGGFLFHGGHLWDKAYALANMTTLVPSDVPNGFFRVQLDIDALEAVASVPEPTSAMLLLVGCAAAIGCGRRCGRHRSR